MRPFTSDHLPHPASSRPDPTRRAPSVRAFLGSLLALALVACGQMDGGSVTSASLERQALGFDAAALIEVMVAPSGPTATADLMAALPPAPSAEAVEVVNRHRPSQVDLVHTLRYPGVTLEVYEASRPPALLPFSVRVERDDVVYRGLHLGLAVEAARALLADAERLPTVAYEAYLVTRDDAAPYTLLLESEGGRVTAFAVTAHLD